MSPSPSDCPDTAHGDLSGKGLPPSAFEASVAAAIDAYGLLCEKDRVLVAVSAGPDSVALLFALRALRGRYGIALSVAHLDHRLRDTAERDQAFVADLASDLALPFHTGHRDVRAFQRDHGLNLEDAARQVRYRFLEETADALNCSKIAVGHQADDTAELVLMNLLRGSGPLGLGGIAPRQGRIIRPLIDIHRAAVMAYLDQKVVRPCHDESNDDLSLTRNRIRHELIPHLEATYNPNLRETLHRTARILREEEAWIESHLDADWSGLLPASGGEGARIDRGGFLKAPAALQRRILRRGLARVAPGLKRIGFDHVEAIRRLADGPLKTPKWLDLPKGLGVAVDAAHITLLAASAAEGGGRRRVKERCSLSTADRYQHEIASPPETSMTVELPEIDARLVLRTATCDRPPMPASPHQALFDLDRLAFPLTLRSARPGDRLRPLGMRGHKKVSDLFVDCKIPKSNRGRHPVMISGGGIVWVAGVRRDHDTRVRADTRRLLIGDFCLLK